MVIRKHTTTTMEAKTPNALMGMISLKKQAKNATPEVKDVTSIVDEAYLKA